MNENLKLNKLVAKEIEALTHEPVPNPNDTDAWYAYIDRHPDYARRLQTKAVIFELDDPIRKVEKKDEAQEKRQNWINTLIRRKRKDGKQVISKRKSILYVGGVIGLIGGGLFWNAIRQPTIAEAAVASASTSAPATPGKAPPTEAKPDVAEADREVEIENLAFAEFAALDSPPPTTPSGNGSAGGAQSEPVFSGVASGGGGPTQVARAPNALGRTLPTPPPGARLGSLGGRGGRSIASPGGSKRSVITTLGAGERVPLSLLAGGAERDAAGLMSGGAAPGPWQPVQAEVGQTELYARNVVQTPSDPFQTAPAPPPEATQEQGETPPSEGEPPYASGTSLSGTLQFGIVVTTGGEDEGAGEVIAQGEDGSVWIGTPTLETSGRMAIAFSTVITDAGSREVQAIALGADNYAGIEASVRETTPALAADLARGVARGVSEYVEELADASTVDFRGSTPIISSDGVPLGESITGSVSRLLSPKEVDQQAIVRVSTVDPGAQLTIVVIR